jgi:hypothetical protein
VGIREHPGRTVPYPTAVNVWLDQARLSSSPLDRVVVFVLDDVAVVDVRLGVVR